MPKRKQTWCSKTMLHAQLYFYFRGMRKANNNITRLQAIQLFRDDFNVPDDILSDENGQRIINSGNTLFFQNGFDLTEQ